MYLIYRSTKDHITERFGVKDLILGRKVPLIVFIKNKSLLQKIVMNELKEDDALIQQEVKLQA